MKKKIHDKAVFILVLIFSISACISNMFSDTKGAATEENSSSTPNHSILTALPTITLIPFFPTKNNTGMPSSNPSVTPTLTTIQKNIQKMLDVVESVEKYFDDYGKYPSSIEELIPYYLDEIPFTIDGYEIVYKTNKVYIYKVGFYPEQYKYCSYLKINNDWECGFSTPP